MPVYTVAVRNVAPRKFMQAARASTSVFRQIGSTLGVAIFRSVLLANQHRDFSSGRAGRNTAHCVEPFLESAHADANPARSLKPLLANIPALVHMLFADVRTLSQAP